MQGQQGSQGDAWKDWKSGTWKSDWKDSSNKKSWRYYNNQESAKNCRECFAGEGSTTNLQDVCKCGATEGHC
eukprot:12886577-Prorocentrum_lima.AAC.1